MICPKCSKEGFGKFCKDCGTKLPEIKKEEVSPDIKRIDIFLKLGVFMVLVAGIILATSNYEFIGDTFKVLLLALISVVFMLLSIVSALFIKIRSTTKSYLLISLLFMVFTLVGIGYFETFGEWFSFGGEGASIVMATIFGLVTIFMFIYDLLFKSRFAKTVGSIAFFLIAPFIFNHFELDFEYAMLYMSIFYFLLHIFAPRKGFIYAVAVIANYLFYLLLFFEIIILDYSFVMVIASVLSLISSLIFTIKDRRKLFVVLNVIASYMVAIATGSLLQSPLDGYDCLTVGLSLFVYLFYYLMVKIFNLKNDEVIYKANNIIGLIAAFILVIFNVCSSAVTILLAAINLLLVNVLNSIGSKTVFYDYIRPIVIIIVGASVINLIDDYVIDILLRNYLVILSGVLFIMHFIDKDEGVKGIDLSLCISLICFNIFGNLVSCGISVSSNIIQLVGLLISYLLYIYTVIKGNKSVGYKVLSVFALMIYMLLLSSIFIGLQPFNLSLTVGSLLCLLVAFINYVLPFKNKFNKYFLTIYSVLPFSVFIRQINLNDDISSLLVSLYLIFILFMTIFPIDKKNSLLKHVLFIIFISFIIFFDIYSPGIYLSILAGVTCLGLIIYSLLQKKYTTSYFIIGVIFSVLNLIHALKDVWSQVPFWLYLLFGGILIIILCTVLLIKEVYKKQD